MSNKILQDISPPYNNTDIRLSELAFLQVPCKQLSWWFPKPWILNWKENTRRLKQHMLFQTVTSGGSCNCSGFCSTFSHSYRLQALSPVTLSTSSCLSVPTHNVMFCKYFRVVLSLSLSLLFLFWSVRLWQPAGRPHPGDKSCSVFTLGTLFVILHILELAKGSCYAVVLLLSLMDFLHFRCNVLPCQDKLHKSQVSFVNLSL